MAVTIHISDCREVLRSLPDESVHCVVTSPPYWGLRDYGTAKWEGGDPDCEHRVGGQVEDGKAPGAITTGQRPGVDASRCQSCGAQRLDSQLGLEQTPDEYVQSMVEVFRQVRRVLRSDGTLWLNLGDSYAAQRGGTCMPAETLAGGVNGKGEATDYADPKRGRLRHGQRQAHRDAAAVGLKHKDLVGIPWRVAFALQADGWWLRQDIIWSKPNPMPESVRDRCTKAHEYLFLLSKSERYYYDADAIAEPVTLTTVERMSQPSLELQAGSDRVPGKTNGPMKAVLKSSGNKERKGATARGCPSEGVDGSVPWEGSTRNKRSVWTVTTQPFSEAHFATFPPALIEPCILAGCPDGGVVLDPFGGAGTTGLVADRHHRDAILIELNPEYAAMAERRIRGESPLFAQVTA